MPPEPAEERLSPVIQFPLPHGYDRGGTAESSEAEYYLDKFPPFVDVSNKKLAWYLFELAPKSRFLHIPADTSQESETKPDNTEPRTSPKSQQAPQEVDISEDTNHWLSPEWQARRPLIVQEEQFAASLREKSWPIARHAKLDPSGTLLDQERKAAEELTQDEFTAGVVWGEVLVRIAEDCLTKEPKQSPILQEILREFYLRRRNAIRFDERRTFQLLRSMTVTVPEEAEALEAGVPGGSDDSKEISKPQQRVSCRTREIPVESLLCTELAVALTSEDPEMYLAGAMFANDSIIQLTIDDLEHGATLILDKPMSKYSDFMRSLQRVLDQTNDPEIAIRLFTIVHGMVQSAESNAEIFDLQRAYDSLSSRIQDPTTLGKMSRDIVNLIQITLSPEWYRDDNVKNLARISRLIAHVTQYGSQDGIIAIIGTLFDNWAPSTKSENAGKFSDFVVDLDLLRTRDDPYSQLQLCSAMQKLLKKHFRYLPLEQMARASVKDAIPRVKSFAQIRDGDSDLLQHAEEVLILGTLDDAQLEDYDRFCANLNSVFKLAIEKPDTIVQILNSWNGISLTSFQWHALFIWYSYPNIAISNADVFPRMCNFLNIPQLCQLLAITDTPDGLKSQVRKAAFDRAHSVLLPFASTLDSFATKKPFYLKHKSNIPPLLYKLAINGKLDQDLKPLVMYMDTNGDLLWRTPEEKTVSHLICDAVGYQSNHDTLNH